MFGYFVSELIFPQNPGLTTDTEFPKRKKTHSEQVSQMAIQT